jgi:hypothetical protein
VGHSLDGINVLEPHFAEFCLYLTAERAWFWVAARSQRVEKHQKRGGGDLDDISPFPALLSCPLSLSRSLSRALSLSFSRSLSLPPPSLSLSLSLSLSRSLSFSLSLFLALSFPPPPHPIPTAPPSGTHQTVARHLSRREVLRCERRAGSLARSVAIRTNSSSLLAIRSLSPTCNAQRKQVHERKQGREKGMARERERTRARRERKRERMREREREASQADGHRANEILRAYKSLLNLCQY